jgi:hypothetical protein
MAKQLVSNPFVLHPQKNKCMWETAIGDVFFRLVSSKADDMTVWEDTTPTLDIAIFDAYTQHAGLCGKCTKIPFEAGPSKHQQLCLICCNDLYNIIQTHCLYIRNNLYNIIVIDNRTDKKMLFVRHANDLHPVLKTVFCLSKQEIGNIYNNGKLQFQNPF